MTDDKIKVAISAAREFIRRAKELMPVSRYMSGTVKSGALRRQSMELTRALAEMRKP